MLDTATLQILEQFKDSLEKPVEVVYRSLGGDTRSSRPKRLCEQPRPTEGTFKSNFSSRDIRASGPSGDVTSDVWFSTPYKCEREDSGYYKGSRWSPPPSARKVHCKRYGLK